MLKTKSFKNIAGIVVLLLIVVFMSSCNRGGTGCPYELSILTDGIFGLLR